jgi:cytochrome c-type biogenesis protein CcmH/NrfG
VKDAIGQWEETLRSDPDNGNAASNLAWVLATSADSTIRNGAQAILLAEKARQLSGGSNPTILRILAAAYAEAGQYGKAVQTAERALQLANAEANASLIKSLAAELELYRADQPLRDTVPAASGTTDEK